MDFCIISVFINNTDLWFSFLSFLLWFWCSNKAGLIHLEFFPCLTWILEGELISLVHMFFSFLLLLWDGLSLSRPNEPKLLILLPQPPEHRDCRPVPQLAESFVLALRGLRQYSGPAAQRSAAQRSAAIFMQNSGVSQSLGFPHGWLTVLLIQ